MALRIAGLAGRGLRLLTAVVTVAMPPAFGQEVWLAVRGPDVHPHGVADWNSLFKPSPEWAAVAAKIQIFSITAGYVVQAPDEDLRAAASDLASRHIALALGMQSVGIGSGDNCGHEEGYGEPGYTARAAEKLHRLGISLQYLALDEPVWFGHYETGPQGCRFAVPELARRVALNVRAYQRYFPDVTIGDIEPVPLLTTFPDWKPIFQSFAHEFALVTGRPLTFLQTDVSWRTPSFESALREISAFARQEGMKFGVIYNGDGGDDSGPAWVADAVRHFEWLETGGGVVPEQAIVASWDPQPTNVLPETSSGTLSHVVARYRLPRTVLTANQDGSAVSGGLTDESGLPVPRARVVLRTVGLDRFRAPVVHVASGTVPSAARFAIIGMRVNSECLCGGPNDLMVGDLRYAESAGGTVVQKYNLAEEAKRRIGQVWNGIEMGVAVADGQSFAHLVVRPDQQFGFNSTTFSVTPGAHFDFQVPIGAVHGDGMYGTAVIIWLDNPHHGLMRTNIYVGREGSVAGSAVTGDDGHFRIVGVSRELLGGGGLEVEFDGDASRRGTELRLP
jgi:hypothetical protein